MTLTSKETINKRVERGAEWLDRRSPGWERKINLSELDLGECDQCIIGQVRGDYWEGLCDLKPKRAQKTEAMIAWSTKRGFDAKRKKGYRALNEAWTRLIKARFDSGRLSDN